MSQMSVLAAVMRSARTPFSMEELRLRDLRPSEVCVRVRAVGICGTDVGVRSGAIAGPVPRVLGHEGAGYVVSVGEDVRGVKNGDPVSLSFSSCGLCRNCRAGRPAYCAHFAELNLGIGGERGVATYSDGKGAAVHGGFFGQSSFATYAISRASDVVKLPAGVPLELCAPLGCGIQTGAGTILNTLSVEPGSSIVIGGAGSVGLSAVMAAEAVGAGEIVAVDTIQSRTRTAEALGATRTVDGRIDTLSKDLLAANKDGFDFAVDTTGNAQVVQSMISALRVGGTIAVIAPFHAGSTIDLGLCNLRGKTIVRVSEGDSIPSDFIPRLVGMYEKGRLPIHRIVTKYPFSEIESAISECGSGRAIKAVLEMPGFEGP